MSFRRPNFPAAFAIALLALAGCGGGGGDTTGPGPASTSSDRIAPAELAPPKAGSKAAAPGVPTSVQGDNSIQTWGREAPSAERRRIGATVQSFLDARAAREWQRVCIGLAARIRREQEQLAEGLSCAEALAAFAATASNATLAEEAEIDVFSLRVGGGSAFLIYRRVDGVYATALTRHDGAWKILTVTPNPLG